MGEGHTPTDGRMKDRKEDQEDRATTGGAAKTKADIMAEEMRVVGMIREKTFKEEEETAIGPITHLADR
jgi:hypothetical protein